jgi:hypothetical protein
LLLIEVPGPWGAAGLAATRLPVEVSRPLAQVLDAAGVRAQLIRRPGRHAARRNPLAITEEGYAWALADPEVGVVRWGRWHDPAELTAVDLAERLDPAIHAITGPQRLALVCTHAKHDVCCAVRGRPVLSAVASSLDRDPWETSHLGGDRFAANLLLLPEGEVFGSLDEQSAVEVARRLDAGRLTLSSYRGRIGRSPLEQAAVHLAAVRLDDDRLGAVRVSGMPRQEGDLWAVPLVHDGHGYVIRLAESWSEPELLTCSALVAKPARRFAVASLTDGQDEQDEHDEQGVGCAG